MLDTRAKQKSSQGDAVQGAGVCGREPIVRWRLREKGGRGEQGGSG